MTDLSTLICIFCRHLCEDGTRCTAFPKGIPDEILFGWHDHRLTFEGDGGTLFELKPGEEANWDEWQDLSEALSQSCEIRINSKW